MCIITPTMCLRLRNKLRYNSYRVVERWRCRAEFWTRHAAARCLRTVAVLHSGDGEGSVVRDCDNASAVCSSSAVYNLVCGSEVERDGWLRKYKNGTARLLLTQCHVKSMRQVVLKQKPFFVPPYQWTPLFKTKSDGILNTRPAFSAFIFLIYSPGCGWSAQESLNCEKFTEWALRGM